ncbi:VanW family protein [Actinotalea sp. JY-7876]|uniref:VanW family protein n=2 Tax=unclassified Actinotalea TaxID=2638618 RepID=UPI0015F6E639|nr:VanW family protein [Actinotalea sp. JY-7876]
MTDGRTLDTAPPTDDDAPREPSPAMPPADAADAQERTETAHAGPAESAPAGAPAEVEPGADEPIADEPIADEAGADEPAADGAGANEPAADEPAADEAGADEPAAEAASPDEPAADVAAEAEVAADEPAAHEPAEADTSAGEPAEAEASTEPGGTEPSAGEPAADEPRAEESAVGEPSAEAAPAATERRSAWQPQPWEAPTVVIPAAALEDQEPAYEPVTAAPGEQRADEGADAAAPAASGPAAPDQPGAPSGTGGEPTTEPPSEPAGDQTQVVPPSGPDAGTRSGSPIDGFEEETRRRRWPRALGIAAAVVVVLAGAYVGALWFWADRVPPGTTVAGVEIGGLDAATAQETLTDALAAATTEPIPVAAGENRTTIDPAVAGLSLDAPATVASVTGFDLRPQRLWQQVFGAGPAAPVTDVDEDALGSAVEDAAAALRVEPVDGTVLFVDGQPATTAPVEGIAIDPDEATETVLEGWLTAARPLELPTEVAEPEIGQDEVDRALAEVARPLVAAPVVVAIADQLAELPPDVLASTASFVPEGSRLELVMNGEALVEEVTARTTGLLTNPSDGSFAFQDGVPVIVPGTPGTTIDPAALASAVAEAGTGADRTAPVELVQVAPTQGEAELQALGVVEVVGEFSTNLTNDYVRTQNLINGAAKINGTLVRPGETFSLIEALGPVDGAHGFHQAGAIVNGLHQDAWGGGLSQLSTTTYNAAFLAGYEDVEHKPHSEWFSRYPEGREATIFIPTLDMKWKNNTPYGALVQAWVGDGKTHVRIWSTKYWTVEHSTSARSNQVSPTTTYSQDPRCEPQSAGNGGFRVTVYRKVSRDGVVHEERSWPVTYRPQNQVVCGPPPAG